MVTNDWLVYLLRCSDNTLYCGITNNLVKRVLAHNTGKGAKYTRGRGPVTVVANVTNLTRSEAAKLEYRVKQQSTVDKKLALFETQHG